MMCMAASSALAAPTGESDVDAERVLTTGPLNPHQTASSLPSNLAFLPLRVPGGSIMVKLRLLLPDPLLDGLALVHLRDGVAEAWATDHRSGVV